MFFVCGFWGFGFWLVMFFRVYCLFIVLLLFIGYLGDGGMGRVVVLFVSFFVYLGVDIWR